MRACPIGFLSHAVATQASEVWISASKRAKAYAVMATPSFGDSEFLLAYCRVCDRKVLTHVALGPGDDEIRCCLHCDEVIAGDLRAVSSDELEANGYGLLQARSCGNGGGCSTSGAASAGMVDCTIGSADDPSRTSQATCLIGTRSRTAHASVMRTSGSTSLRWRCVIDLAASRGLAPSPDGGDAFARLTPCAPTHAAAAWSLLSE